MKIMAFSLALITLLFSVAPCCNGESHCEDKVTQECADHCDTDQDMPDTDPPCSPFYTCGACLGFVSQTVSPYIFSHLFFSQGDFNSFYSGSLSASHLHPPLKPPVQI
ncbi:hypothetical protein QQ008_19540 [Fulvivirgaceae bacterium BMA10]|uniref:Uncharacterized protein n=1 Tax=Splendidivirga corallicola TaxID=3051826 RepID=A0ABT8KS83_9BACT|nr:hypothetical protein [Fulvivirgaceae bacterium BMA10]